MYKCIRGSGIVPCTFWEFKINLVKNLGVIFFTMSLKISFKNIEWRRLAIVYSFGRSQSFEKLEQRYGL